MFVRPSVFPEQNFLMKIELMAVQFCKPMTLVLNEFDLLMTLLEVKRFLQVNIEEHERTIFHCKFWE